MAFGEGGRYQTKLGSAHQSVKPIYWHQVMVKESTVFLAGMKQEVQVAHAQNIWTPQWLSE